jgi:hypothetical protein
VRSELPTTVSDLVVLQASLMMWLFDAGYNTLPAEANDTAHRLLQPVGPDGGLGVQVTTCSMALAISTPKHSASNCHRQEAMFFAPADNGEQVAALHLYIYPARVSQRIVV